ncbi:MAG: substrate-binding domain-containing protein [Chloroflexi bacterium]|nr:substrate-binding domain-containing protein [Chloroflexota bacterium]
MSINMLVARSKYLTIGVLPGWEVYENAILLDFLRPLLHGIRSAARSQECNLLLACGIGPADVLQTGSIRPAWPVLAPEVDFVPVGPWNTDGLIVVNPLSSETRTRYIHDLAAAGHPIVFVGTAQGGPAVAVDNEGGIRQAMSHLIEHGHRRIAFIAGSPDDTCGDSEERLRTYQSVIQEQGLEADPNLVSYGFHIVAGGQEAMQQILETGTSFTAVLASSDECAIGAMQVLKESGFRIPQDVAVVGFDNLSEAVVQVPPLTTVHSLTFERGYRSLELLLQYIEGQKQDTEIIKVATRLVVRQSCGCQPKEVISPLYDDDTTRQLSCADLNVALVQLANTMAEVVLTGARYLSSDSVYVLCQRLVKAFVLSLDRDDPMDFDLTFKEILQRVKMVGDDAHVWQDAISVVKDEIPVLSKSRRGTTTRQLAEDMLHRARIAISEVVQHQYRQYIFDQRWMTDRVALLTSRLLAALDDDRAFEALAEHLPAMGIQYAGVATFESEQDDLVAWSTLRTVPNLDDMPVRFPSRQFPPEGFGPNQEPFNMALLPLSIQGESSGFVAFDAGNLELCGAVVQQLSTALRSARLYREATEGRHLAEEANRMKSRFLSTVSHELRTPLNLIVGLSEMVLREERNDKHHRQDIERIHASAQHLDGLIRDVLDLAQSDMGRLKLVCEPLDLAEVLQVVTVVGDQLARDRGPSWRAEIPADLPQVWGDRTRLRQVVLNLVNNALKFTARGQVTLWAESNDDTVTVAISDTGLGIPIEEQQVIFDEFRQSERATARGYGGLGLGLAICKRLVEMHGGEIGVRSSGEEGAGSTFYFTLPVAKDVAVEPKTAMPLGQRVLLLAEQSASGKRLLEHLTERGFEVDALWIDETVDWLSQLLREFPGAVVLDLALASKRGWEVLKVLKGNPSTREIPTLFYQLTQDRDNGSMLELDYLTKPVGTGELLQSLERLGLINVQDGAKSILIVDDEPGILEMHARVVQASSPSCRVLEARNGREALTVMRRERPDLVLLDLMMPELDGFGVLEAMRDEEIIHNIPVIVLTSQVLTEEDMARLNRGVTAVLGKGIFTVEETLSHIEEALARNRKLGTQAQRLVRKAMAYIHIHYAEPISRQDIARHVSVSNSYLSRCFRQEMGVSLTAYLNRYRVNQAKVLLAKGEMNVTEVAMAVGFSDSAYFSQVFRRQVGIPPSAYRDTLTI